MELAARQSRSPGARRLLLTLRSIYHAALSTGYSREFNGFRPETGMVNILSYRA
jgi:hypothetical protein